MFLSLNSFSLSQASPSESTRLVGTGQSSIDLRHRQWKSRRPTEQVCATYLTSGKRQWHKHIHACDGRTWPQRSAAPDSSGRTSDNAGNQCGVLLMGCLKFDGHRVNGPLAVFVFPSSHGHKEKARTIDIPDARYSTFVHRQWKSRRPKEQVCATHQIVGGPMRRYPAAETASFARELTARRTRLARLRIKVGESFSAGISSNCLIPARAAWSRASTSISYRVSM